MGTHGVRRPAAHRRRGRLGEGRAGPPLANRRAVALGTTALATLIAAAACSRETRHKVLVFFYDGVPPLDAHVAEAVVRGPTDSAAPATGSAPRRRPAPKTFYNHPLYGENRCDSCHRRSGRLLKTVRHGLCQDCHFVKPAEKKKYLHGPVAVNGCLVCHRFHESRHPKMLITDAQTLCSHCHDEGELAAEEHHATIDKERCVDCHDPHGGDDRFFLLPGAREAGPTENALILERKR